VSRGTQESLERGLQFMIRGYHPLWPDFPDRSLIAFLSLVNTRDLTSVTRLRLLRFVILQPRSLLANRPVWAVPISLATTFGITVVFSSSGY
jgi:hypothetical protein